jgi:cytidine deaminase
VSGPEVDPAALLTAAREARKAAYAPYSRFPVGAAIQTAAGTVYRGCNVENASYGLTICAERVAVMTAVAAGERQVVAVAIDGGDADKPAPPCGACRQVLHEFGPDMQVILPGVGEAALEVLPLRAFLPRGFGPQDLLGEDARG